MEKSLTHRIAALAGAVVLAALACSTAQAGILLSNTPSGTVGFTETPSRPFADEFVLGSAASLTSIAGFGQNIGTPIGQFIVSVYTDSAGVPGPSLLTFTTSTFSATDLGVSSPFGEFFRYDIDLATPFVLSSGTDYWITINTASGEFNWMTSNSGLGDAFFNNGWTKIGDKLAFELDGTANSVPEPLTLSLFGAGLAGVASMRRRKKMDDRQPV